MNYIKTLRKEGYLNEPIEKETVIAGFETFLPDVEGLLIGENCKTSASVVFDLYEPNKNINVITVGIAGEGMNFKIRAICN
ncbi:hypothetical protein [Geosporobacter ferrireducens]|uniref:Uncharacterized protein n=1 Tax=Geosporobacter ferrireducens TaxID=1424294 RepID=A0A1D8GBR3_9FIRM|nr:hypothetical protein [Geosporobacter ferrireducens]AOT68352.1 hypothetical protein Gferi_01330 [Geosporobacter ferrireducens]